MGLPRKLILLFVICFSLLKINAQLSIKLGRDTIYCLPLFPSDTTYLGKNLIIENGQPPYIYAWECEVKIGATGFYTASDFLNDTTISTPFFIDRYPFNTWIKYILTVSDTNNSIAKDTIYIKFSNFGYSEVTYLVYLNQGDSIQFDGISYINGGVSPLQFAWVPKLGLSDPNNLSTWCKPDSSTDYYQIAADSFGCLSIPNHVYKIIIPPTGFNEIYKENINEKINPIQKDSRIIFYNPQRKESLISIYNLNGQNVLNLKTMDNSIELAHLIQKRGIYIIKVVIEKKIGEVKYIKK